MIIPKKIKVGALMYEVFFSEDVTNESDAYGSTHNSKEKIFISPKYSKQRQEVTFLHELMHACFEMSGLNNRFENKKIEEIPTAEDVVREVSILLYQVIKDNPKLFI